MPCRDYYDDHPGQYYEDRVIPRYKEKIAFLESALCGALTAIERLNPGNNLDDINFEEAGIKKKELEAWRKEHQKQDALRKAEEEERRKKLKSAALEKLTDEEKEILGL